MRLDIEDILVGAIASVTGRFFLVVAAIWVGSLIGAGGLIAGDMVENMRWSPHGALRLFLQSPLLLFSSWALLNIPFLGFMSYRFIRDEGDSYLMWGIVLGVESLMVMAGWAHVSAQGWLPRTCAWFAWAILLTMAGTGIWLVRQHLINNWARELGMLRAENAQRRAQREDEERARIALEDDR